MVKFGSIALGALLLFSGSAAVSHRPKGETLYRDSAATYAGANIDTYTTETKTISYTTRTTDPYSLAYKIPTFTYSPALGACAAVGGGNLIGFFDRYDENLIPNHTSGRAIGSMYMYSSQDAAVEAVIDELYDYMGTKSTGTTEAQFKQGITNFCADKGHTVTYSSCMQGSSFSYSKAQSYLKSNQPVVLFLSSYNVTQIVEKSNKDTLTIRVSEVPHIMVAFGYKTYVYDGTTYNYLSVATGIDKETNNLFNINYKTKIDDALAINLS